MTIKKVLLLPNDRTAVENLCLDNNGDTCALIKIKTDNVEGIHFSNPNQYIKSSYENGVYSVYIPVNIGRKLDFIHKDYMPVQLDFSDYGYRHLKKGKTYMVILETPKISELISSVVLKVEPKDSRIIFDGSSFVANSSGTFEIPVTVGRHSYWVSADNFHSYNSSISVGKSEVKTISVRLQPIMHEVLIVCNIKKARVFVDNTEYGVIGRLRIPQGSHTIRVQADGYIDEEKNVDIVSSTGSLVFSLKENKEVSYVHATPVTIYSNFSNIYKNNKKIKGWYNGAIIMFMPGYYMLSDDKGKSKKIIVGDKPMRISF